MDKTREIIRADVLSGVPHGFFTGVGFEGAPDPQLILFSGVLASPKQVHSNKALLVDHPFEEGEKPLVDAFVTKTPGLVLGIVTADCGPVLLADKEAGIVAAAHAGWRGAHGGVLEETLDLMEGQGADISRISAAIGPMIAQGSYEVDEGLKAQFSSRDEAFFASGTRPDHYQFDLEGYIAARLKAHGVRNISKSGLDTYTGATRFHSFRRATHKNEPTYGRQYSLISLP